MVDVACKTVKQQAANLIQCFLNSGIIQEEQSLAGPVTVFVGWSFLLLGDVEDLQPQFSDTVFELDANFCT